MKLKYNLYRVYQVLFYISHGVVSNKYELLVSLLLGRSKIPLRLTNTNLKLEFPNTKKILAMLDLLKIISISKSYELKPNGVLSISFDGISFFQIPLIDRTIADEKLISFLADGFTNGSTIIPKEKMNMYALTDKDFILYDLNGERIIETLTGAKFFLKYYNYPIVETFTLKVHDMSLLPNLENKIVVDIGADTGNTALYFASKGALVYAMEIEKPRYEMILEHITLNPDLAGKIIPVNAGLGKDGEIEFYSDPLGFMDPTIFKARYDDHLKKPNVQKVKGYTLKSFRTHYKLDSIDYLKMDCKGAEFTLTEDDIKNVKNVKIEYMALDKDHKIENLLKTFMNVGFKVRLFKHDSTIYKSFNVSGDIFATTNHADN